MKIFRTSSENTHFKTLISHLDATLKIVNGDKDDFFSQHNKVDKIKHVVLLYENEEPIACGAIKAFNSNAMEVKRMFTNPAYRGNGCASAVLNELETWAKELGYTECVLETSIMQPDALALYAKNNYLRTKNYDPYVGVAESACFSKQL